MSYKSMKIWNQLKFWGTFILKESQGIEILLILKHFLK